MATRIIQTSDGKLYAVCPDCGQLVRINKPIIGSLHVCLSEEERRQGVAPKGE